MAVAWVTLLGEPKKYGVLGTSRREAGTTKRNRTGRLVGGILWTNGGDVEVEQMNLRNPVQWVSQVW